MTEHDVTSVFAVIALFGTLGVLLWINAKWRNWINKK